MKLFFKLFMALHTGIFRLSKGKLGGQMNGFTVMLLTTTGRKSGKQTTAPLGCFNRDGGLLIVASNAGQANHPAWYHNLSANPRCRVEIGASDYAAEATILQGEQREQAWQQVVSEAPAYKAYQTSTTRQIPLVLLKPVA